MRKYRRIFLVVLDSLGVGAMPDAAAYGDAGTNTLGHIAAYRHAKGETLRIPNLLKLGIGELTSLEGCISEKVRMGYHGILKEASR